jgi:hypothetical protein
MCDAIKKISCTYEKEFYCAEYDSFICCAELIRNCCVNLALDPDMSQGFVHNIKVLKKNSSGQWQLWPYKPNETLHDCCPGRCLELKFELI